MSDAATVDLFIEDRAHEEFLRPLIGRVAAEENVPVTVRVRSARGGHGRAIREFELYQTVLENEAAFTIAPDLVIVGIDGNCTTFAKKRAEILAAAHESTRHRLVAACPDPHVERWYLSDPASFQVVVGQRPNVGRKKCARDYYKDLLAKTVRQAGHPATLGGLEFAREIVEALDLYRAGRGDKSLKAFLDDLRAGLRRQRGTATGGRS